MIIEHKPQDYVQMSHDMETTAFSIEQSAKAFVVLSSSLYKDKARSIVRELSCNARDAHVDAGNEKTPFDVHLPTPMEPEFWIRDYGTGLSDEHIKTVYTRYFKSTKESNNDAVGCLGLGSKSPFAYTQSFMVTSWFRGTKTIYSVFINDHNEPAIAKMLQVKVDEPNGLEVRFNVPVEDQNKFEVACQRVFIWFDKVKPNFVGRQCPDSGAVQTEMAGLVLTKQRFHSYNGTLATSIVMAGVEYPIDLNNPEVKKQENLIAFIKSIRDNNNVTVSAHVEMGAIDFTPSREELQYTKKTLKALNEVFLNAKKKIKSLLPDLTEKDFSGISFQEAMVIVDKFANNRKKISSDTGLVESVFQQNASIAKLIDDEFSVCQIFKNHIFEYGWKSAGKASGWCRITDKDLGWVTCLIGKQVVISNATGIGHSDFEKFRPGKKAVFLKDSSSVLPGAMVKDVSIRAELEKLGFECVLATDILGVKLSDRKYSSIYVANIKNDSVDSSTITFSTAANKDKIEDIQEKIFYVELSNKRASFKTMGEFEFAKLVYFATLTNFKFKIVGVYMPTRVDLINALDFETHFAKELDFWMQSAINRNIFINEKINRLKVIISETKYSNFRKQIEAAIEECSPTSLNSDIKMVEAINADVKLASISGISFIHKWKGSQSKSLLKDFGNTFPKTAEKCKSLCKFNENNFEMMKMVENTLTHISNNFSNGIERGRDKEIIALAKSVYNLISSKNS